MFGPSKKEMYREIYGHKGKLCQKTWIFLNPIKGLREKVTDLQNALAWEQRKVNTLQAEIDKLKGVVAELTDYVYRENK